MWAQSYMVTSQPIWGSISLTHLMGQWSCPCHIHVDHFLTWLLDFVGMVDCSPCTLTLADLSFASRIPTHLTTPSNIHLQLAFSNISGIAHILICPMWSAPTHNSIKLIDRYPKSRLMKASSQGLKWTTSLWIFVLMDIPNVPFKWMELDPSLPLFLEFAPD